MEKGFKKEKFYDDIKYMFNVISENHPNLFFNISEKELNGFVDNYMKMKHIDTYEESIYYLMQILNRIGDSHTVLSYDYNKAKIDFTIIDGIVYVKKYDINPSLVGGKLTCINGIDINSILRELQEIIVPRTVDGIYSCMEEYLSNKNIIKILPSIGKTDRIKYTIKKEDKTYKVKDEISVINEEPKNDKDYYKYELIDNTLIVNYKKCKNMKDYTFNDMVNDIKTKTNINSVIVDLRGNNGGNSELIKPLLNVIKDKNIVTIVDKNVFSSGIMSLMDLKNIGSVIVGTNVAERINSFGETLHGNTPNYNINFICSKKYFYYEDGELKYLEGKKEYDEFFSKIDNMKYSYPVWVQPDYYIQNSYNDLVNNTDSVLDKALDILSKKNN